MQMAVASSLKRKYGRLISAESVGERLRLLAGEAAYYALIVPTLIGTPVVILVLELIWPLVPVRIGYFNSERIGHLTNNTDAYLRRQVLLGRSRREFRLMIASVISNRQMLTMMRRKLSCILIESRTAARLLRRAGRWKPDSKVWLFMPVGEYAFKEFTEVPSQISFTPEEMVRGRDSLARMGIGPDDEFVCFHARDRAYLDRSWSIGREVWARHDYRDCDVRNYLPAAEYLASLGMFAVRMGHLVEHPIESSSLRVIDYAVKYRTDFDDVFLSGNCKFFLANNAGLLCVAKAFDVPVASANWIPIGQALSGPRDVFIPKKLWSIEKKRFLTFREIIMSGVDNWFNSKLYDDAAIEVVENSSEEILALAKEMNARIDGTWVGIDEDEELQRRYRSLYRPDHPSYGFPSRVGAEFLRENQELLE